MYRCVFIGDKKIGTGFLFTGIDAYEAEELSEAEKYCTQILETGEFEKDLGLVLVQENLWDGMDPELKERLSGLILPVVIPVETRIGAADER